MVTITRNRIYLQNFETFEAHVQIFPEAWSYYFTLGYSLLKSLIRSKLFPFIFKDHIAKLSEILSKSAQLESNQKYIVHIQTLESLIGIFKQSEDIENCHRLLNYYMQPDQYLGPVCYASYAICNTISELNKETLQSILKSQPLRLVEYFIKIFPINICIIWLDGCFWYREPGPNRGLVYMLYETLPDGEHKYSYLIRKNDDEVEVQLTKKKQYFNRFFCSFQVPLSSAQDLETEFPQLSQFLAIAAGTLIENRKYDIEVANALKYAIEEIPDLGKLIPMNDLINLTPGSCSIHRDKDNITLSCGKFHCLLCFFSALKGPAKEIYCPCKVKVAPKLVFSTKQDSRFKEYLKASS